MYKLLKATETDRNYCLSNYEARLVLVLVFAVLSVLVKVVVVVVLLPLLVIWHTTSQVQPVRGGFWPKRRGFGSS